ncbi:GntR family transcriptional regulator [Sphaerisporangium siamense]|uniref:GntR family transcriptional regulator n=1 Tax=Sphaerisporangium siamense TaxID=795645 RepID=A0A7W7D6E0_9ACTN|nr:GntR family transcriptional regulator [Sphaerisporangium siamense]MBB4701085.1 GntR family transcriptional regulator [Sphaerisporangium siamense]GII89375.1 GntR family transcriptional regulator [Sphaerisporangium siamense]
MEFHLDRGSGVATYLQLVHQVKHALRLGTLVPGDRLPTAKEVVEKLAINPNTVLKAYRELEREGLVTARPGQGTFVERTLGGASLAEHARLRRDLLRWVRTAREAGLDQEDVQALIASAVGEAFRDHQQEPATRKDEIA